MAAKSSDQYGLCGSCGRSWCNDENSIVWGSRRMCKDCIKEAWFPDRSSEDYEQWWQRQVEARTRS